MKICILLPGFVKSYEHLNYLSCLFKKIKCEKIYVFGHIFSYMIPPDVAKDRISYGKDNNILLDINKLDVFTSYNFVSDNYKELDEDGYDNRIYSQWYNVKKSYDLYVSYNKENNINCDMFIRMRPDIYINDIDKLNKYINHSYLENKLMVAGNKKKFTDIIFIGPEEYFKKVVNLCDFMNEYYLLKFVQNRIKKTKPSKNNLRFGTMSEILFSYHVRENIRDSYLVNSDCEFFKINRS